MEVPVHKIDNPLQTYEVLPTFRYTIDDPPNPVVSNQNWENLVEFIDTNLSLVQNRTPAYLEGFRDALAVVRLYLDTAAPAHIPQN